MWWCDGCNATIFKVIRKKKSAQGRRGRVYAGLANRMWCGNKGKCHRRYQSGSCLHLWTVTYQQPSERLCSSCGSVISNDKRVYQYMINEEGWQLALCQQG